MALSRASAFWQMPDVPQTGQPRAIKRYSDFTLATVGDLNDLPMIMGVLA